MLFSFPLMAAIHEISGRMERTTGQGLASNIRRHYPAWLLNVIVSLLFITNTINIGADLGAIGDALALLIGGPDLIYVFLAGVLCTAAQVLADYSRIASMLKWLTLSLFAYFGTVMAARVPWGEMSRAFHTLAFGIYRILDGHRGHTWHNYQPVSIFLAGVARGGGYRSHAGTRTIESCSSSGRERFRAHPV
jgi:hypothetical protein